MANADGELTVAQRLGRALDRGLLPAGGPAEAAERLIERLERPARIALLGLPGAGKSSILNLLVGSVVVAETLRLPTIIVQHGDVSRMICTMTDGTTKIVTGADLAEVLPLAPALVTLELDLPALRVISLLEVSAGPMEAEQKRAATWASKRADIVIWCTTSYLPKEQSVWESLPDGVKDNSFMFLTKVDLLGSRDSAQAMHERVELRAGEEFRQILSISAKQARAAMPAGGPVNRDLFRDSGASAVITAIKTRVQSGRRADMDTAELLLARHAEASELVAKRFSDAEEEAARTWAAPPEPEALPEPAPPTPAVVEVAASYPLETESQAGSVVETHPFVDHEQEPEPEPEPAPEPEADVLPKVAAPAVPDLPPELIEPSVPEGAEGRAAAYPEPEPEAEPEPGTRRRFADRIKRVASDADPAVSPAVPLRSTWKSKAETEAPSQAQVAEPEMMRTEATRRPRASAKDDPVAGEPVALEPVAVVEPEPIPDESFAPPEDTSDLAGVEESSALDPEVPAVALPPPERPSLRDRPGRAVTPRPAPVAEPPPSARPQLFGSRRPAATGRDAPLPDLSSLRATAEEMEAALEDSAPAGDEGLESGSLVEPQVEATDPEPSPAPPAARALDRPRLFDREPRVQPAVPAEAPLMPRATPISRSPRMAVTPAPAAATSPATPVADDQFSAAAIMRQSPRAVPDSSAPRRERTRIAARAVPAALNPVAANPVSAAENALLDEAIGIIVSRSAELVAEIDPAAKAPVDMILDHARETGELVQGVVARGRSEDLRRINSEAGEVMDFIMLMQLEKGHAPADDALSLILQLKRELETLRAV